MLTLLGWLIDFYSFINSSLGLGGLNDFLHVNLLVAPQISSFQSLLFFLLGLGLLNLIHRPSKYRYNIFWMPGKIQIVFRQIMFVVILTNSLVVFALVFAFLLGFVLDVRLFVNTTGRKRNLDPYQRYTLNELDGTHDAIRNIKNIRNKNKK